MFLFTIIDTLGIASEKYYLGKGHKEGIIFKPTYTVNSSTTTNTVKFFVVHQGPKVQIIDHVLNWIKIRIADGSVGWLPMSSIQEI